MRWAAEVTQQSWTPTASGILTPIPFRKMSRIMRPHGGNVGVVIAAPGVGKTTFLLNWAVKSGARTMYLSPDTSPQDLTSQLGALASGSPRKEVEDRLLSSASWRREYGRHIAREFPNLVLDFTASPSMTSIDEKVDALTELWAATPQIVVIDTASNIEMKDSSDNAEWTKVWLSSVEIARKYNLFVVLAHHVKQGAAAGGRVAPQMNDGLWGCDKFAEFVIGLHTPGPKLMAATIRKNRSGPKDVPIQFVTDLSRAEIREKEQNDG